MEAMHISPRTHSFSFVLFFIEPFEAPSDEEDRISRNKRNMSDEEHIKRMQKEFEQKRKELLLEAENVVRMREEAYNQELLKLQTELEKHRRVQKEAIESEREKRGGTHILLAEYDHQDKINKTSDNVTKNCALQ